MSWQPMQTAPRDGTRIIGWFGDRCIVVFWRSGPEYVKSAAGVQRATSNTVWYWSDGYSRYREPDCWQSEPSPPDAAQFTIKQPAPKRGPTTVVASPAARRRLVEQKPKRVIEAKPARTLIAGNLWCAQCERRVPTTAAAKCASPFCKAKEQVA